MRLHRPEELAHTTFDRVVDRDVDERARLAPARREIGRRDHAAMLASERANGVRVRDLFDGRGEACLDQILRCSMSGELSREIFEGTDGRSLEGSAPGKVFADIELVSS
jgi:hypothetical protein